jgi:hypothetical protein
VPAMPSTSNAMSTRNRVEVDHSPIAADAGGV